MESVSRKKQLDFGLQKLPIIEIKSNLTARAFKIRKSLRNRVLLPVKRILYFQGFSVLYDVYYCIKTFLNQLVHACKNYSTCLEKKQPHLLRQQFLSFFLGMCIISTVLTLALRIALHVSETQEKMSFSSYLLVHDETIFLRFFGTI